ncbi:MAG: hypothetical protein H6662_06865 [Ardenticatenaceae bacterium]|nr:hypothetical protein [Anaerolineales bacterium]MCB8921287.1 hypothetical protein [Ardenticatenaceae bacterium]MCB8990653.1 hypothetical protein [Ardenticatenaceae bacterium]
MQTVIVHIHNEDPVVCEIEEIPAQNAQFIIIHNPRRRDGSDVHYLDEDVSSVLFPMHRVNFIQLLPSADVEEIIGFVRE